MHRVKITYRSGRVDHVESDGYDDIAELIQDISTSHFYLHTGGAINVMEVESIKPASTAKMDIRRLK